MESTSHATEIPPLAGGEREESMLVPFLIRSLSLINPINPFSLCIMVLKGVRQPTVELDVSPMIWRNLNANGFRQAKVP